MKLPNLNSFVQERIVGMKILQVFSREEIEMERFKGINNKHKKRVGSRPYGIILFFFLLLRFYHH